MSKSEGDSGLDSQISSQPQQNDSFERTQLFEGMSAMSRSSGTATQDRAGDSGSLDFNTNELYKGLDSSYPKGNVGSGAIDFSPPPVSGAHGQSETAGHQHDSSQPPMAGSDLLYSAGGSPVQADSPDLSEAQDLGAMLGSPVAAGQAEQGVMHSVPHSGNALDGQSGVASADHFSGLAKDGHRSEGNQLQNTDSLSSGSGSEMSQYATGSPLSVDGSALAGDQDTGAMHGAAATAGNAEFGTINSVSNPGLVNDAPMSGPRVEQSVGPSGDGHRGDAPDFQTSGVSLPPLSSGNSEGTMSPRERTFQSWSGHFAQPTEGALKSAHGDGVEPQRAASGLGRADGDTALSGGPLNASGGNGSGRDGGGGNTGGDGGGKGRDDGDGGDKTTRLQTEKTEATLPNFPDAEEVRKMSPESLERLVAENRAAIENFIVQNRERLPSAWAVHGGSKESNDLMLSTQGGRITPPQSSRSEDTMWAAAVTSKDANPSTIAADIAKSFDVARYYADSGKGTPGGISVIDLSKEASQAQRRASFIAPEYAEKERTNLLHSQSKASEDYFHGLGHSRNVALGVIRDPEEHFADRTFKGIIDKSCLNRYDQLISNSTNGQGIQDQQLLALRSQFEVVEGLKLLLKK